MREAIIGARGAIGRELAQLLSKKAPLLIPSKAFSNSFESNFDRSHFDENGFEKIDIAYFCLPNEGAKKLIPIARKYGTICIDASSAYRHEPSVPLIIPEINGEEISNHQGIIASPNCTTTLMLLPLFPLHRAFGIKRIVVSTYQAASGAGRKGVEELSKQSLDFLQGKKISPSFFPQLCAFNVFPHESAEEEEGKMVKETKKILQDAQIKVAARCIRVPVFRVHSQAVNVEFHQTVNIEQVYALLEDAPSVILGPSFSALDAKGKHPVYCSGVRLDLNQPNTVEMWIVGDQLLKGGALNMAQIGEQLCSR